MRSKLVPLAAIAGDTQAIAVAWARYAEEVVRHTSEASQALLRAHTFNSEASQALLRAHTFKEMLEVQAKLRRDTMQSFHDQIVEIAETASRKATRPHNALKEASIEQAGD
jgi:hypothetical protein